MRSLFQLESEQCRDLLKELYPTCIIVVVFLHLPSPHFYIAYFEVLGCISPPRVSPFLRVFSVSLVLFFFPLTPLPLPSTFYPRLPVPLSPSLAGRRHPPDGHRRPHRRVAARPRWAGQPCQTGSSEWRGLRVTGPAGVLERQLCTALKWSPGNHFISLRGLWRLVFCAKFLCGGGDAACSLHFLCVFDF